MTVDPEDIEEGRTAVEIANLAMTLIINLVEQHHSNPAEVMALTFTAIDSLTADAISQFITPAGWEGALEVHVGHVREQFEEMRKADDEASSHPQH